MRRKNRLNIKVINKVIEIISIEILWIFSTAKYVPRIIKNTKKIKRFKIKIDISILNNC